MHVEEPLVDAYFPAAHEIHVSIAVAPKVVEYFPARHDVQLDEDTPKAYVPEEHVIADTKSSLAFIAIIIIKTIS